MIRISSKARAHIASLATYYTELDRPEAARNLRAIVAKAADRIETKRGPFFPAPRPYPQASLPGWLWLKQGPYWIGFASGQHGLVIRAVFHEAADIPSRL